MKHYLSKPEGNTPVQILYIPDRHDEYQSRRHEEYGRQRVQYPKR